MIYVGSN